jgi:hypothetical protein
MRKFLMQQAALMAMAEISKMDMHGRTVTSTVTDEYPDEADLFQNIKKPKVRARKIAEWKARQGL